MLTPNSEGALTATVNEPFTGSSGALATFTDSASTSTADFLALITWESPDGYNETTRGDIGYVSGPSPYFTIEGQHTYCALGTETPYIQLFDLTNGNPASGNTSITMLDTLTATPIPVAIDSAAAGDYVPVAYFTDSDPEPSLAEYTASVIGGYSDIEVEPANDGGGYYVDVLGASGIGDVTISKTIDGNSVDTTVSESQLALNNGGVVDLDSLSIPSGSNLAISNNTLLDLDDSTLSLANVVFAGAGITDGSLFANSVSATDGYLSAALTASSTTVSAGGSLTMGGSVTDSLGATTLDGGLAIGDGNGVTVDTSSVSIAAGGAVTVGAGESWIASAGVTNNGTLINNGTVTVTADTLENDNSATNNGSITAMHYDGDLLNNGVLTLDGTNNNYVMDGIISGSGSLVQDGPNTVTLTGANSYSGGTMVNAGTLQIGNGGTTGSIAGNVVDNAGLAFFRSDSNVTFYGAIGGSGGVANLGDGTLTLAGPASFTGTTTGNVIRSQAIVAGHVAGNLDQQHFGNRGSGTALGPAGDNAQWSAISPDTGQIVTSCGQFLDVYWPNGAPDWTIGLPSAMSGFGPVAIQGTGSGERIIVANGNYNGGTISVAAFKLASGLPDDTFGTSNGIATLTLPAGIRCSRSTAFSSGLLTVRSPSRASSKSAAGWTTKSAWRRFDATGQNAPSFALATVTPIDWDNGSGAAMDSQGNIVVTFAVATTESSDELGVVRFNEAGSLDTAFGSSGLATVCLPSGMQSGGNAVAIQPGINGDIVVAGSAWDLSDNCPAVVAAFSSSGVPDTGFNDNCGYALGPDFSTATAVVAQPDGKVVVGFQYWGNGNASFSLTRLNSDGTTDTSFGGAPSAPARSAPFSRREAIPCRRPAWARWIFRPTATW